MDNEPIQPTPPPAPAPIAPPPPVEPNPIQSPPPQAPVEPDIKEKRGVSKWLLIGAVVVILLLVLGAVGFMTLNNNSKSAAPTPTPADESSKQVAPTETPTPTTAEMTTYTSAKLANISFSGYTLDHPEEWVETSARDENVGTAKLTLTKGAYSIVIAQGPFDGGVCLYTDAEFNANQGPASDKRGKPTTDLVASFGNLKRDLETSATGASYAFCQQSTQDSSYGSLTKVGAVSYTGPATFDTATLAEMDAIIKSVKTL